MIFVFFFQSFSIPFPFHFHPILWKINGTKMERYIPLFAVKVENGMEWNGTPFCRPMIGGAPAPPSPRGGIVPITLRLILLTSFKIKLNYFTPIDVG